MLAGVARVTSERDAAKASGKAEDSEARAPSSVERSLEEFIARANAVAPPAPPARPTFLDDSSPTGKRRRKEELGPDDRTEIVSRPLPYTPPSNRRFVWTMVALAFVAGGGAVVLALRLFSRPTPVAAPAPAPIPPVVVIPQPTVETLPEAHTTFTFEAKPVEAESKPAAAKPEPQPPQNQKTTKTKKKPDKDGKPATGLVDPFAD